MSRFNNTFKKPALNLEDQRQSRFRDFARSRKDRRGQSFAARRNVEFTEEDTGDNLDSGNNENHQIQDVQPQKKDEVKLRLLKWKEEKEKQKLKEVQLKSRGRPPFKAGNVHHNLNPTIDILPVNFGKSCIPKIAKNKSSSNSTQAKKFEFTALKAMPVTLPINIKSNAASNLRGGKVVVGGIRQAGTQPRAQPPVNVCPPTTTAHQVEQTRSLRSRAVIVTNPASISAAKPVKTASINTTIAQPSSIPKVSVTQTATLSKSSIVAAADSANTKRSARVTPATQGHSSVYKSSVKQTPTPSKPSIAAETATKRSARVTPATQGHSSVYKSSVKQTPTPSKPSIAAETATKRSAATNEKNSVSASSAKQAATPSRSGKAAKPEEDKLITKNTPAPLGHTSGSPTKSSKPIAQQVEKGEALNKVELNKDSGCTGAATRVSTRQAAAASEKENSQPPASPCNQVATGALEVPEEEVEHGCDYFRKVLADTISLLEEMCVFWEHESSKVVISEEAREQLLLATGMARLLVREKFAQFRGLINKCEVPIDDTVTLCSDLQGFWDMIYIQVEDIKMKFKHLEAMKNNNWAPIKPAAQNKIQKKKASGAKPKPAAPQARSNFRAFIAASRKNNEANLNEIVTPRRSVARNSVGTPLQLAKKKVDSPNVSAILSASRVAKSAGKKSFAAEETGNLGVMVSSPPVCMTRHTVATNLASTSSKKSLLHRSILKKGEEPTPQAAPLKKSVIFSASIPEEKDDGLHISPAIRTYGQHSAVSPIKDMFEELSSTPTYVHPNAVLAVEDKLKNMSVSQAARKPSLLYTPPQTSESVSQAQERKDTHKFLVKPPTPYSGKSGKGRKLSLKAGGSKTANDASSSSQLATGRQSHCSTSEGLTAECATPTTPDLISWDSPGLGGSPNKLRRSSRFNSRNMLA